MINSPQRLKDLIRNMAKRINGQPHILMRNYMMERFLERLARSTYSDKFILKGGMLVASMIGLDIRATMDIDATIKGATLSIDSSRKIIEEITGIHLEDGIQFIIKIKIAIKKLKNLFKIFYLLVIINLAIRSTSTRCTRQVLIPKL